MEATYHQPTHNRTDYFYHTTTSESTSDVIGGYAAKGALSLFTGFGERVDPGLTPGIEAAKYGINQWIDSDIASRSVRTTLQPRQTEVFDPGYYSYDLDPVAPEPQYNPYSW